MDTQAGTAMLARVFRHLATDSDRIVGERVDVVGLLAGHAEAKGLDEAIIAIGEDGVALGADVDSVGMVDRHNGPPVR